MSIKSKYYQLPKEEFDTYLRNVKNAPSTRFFLTDTTHPYFYALSQESYQQQAYQDPAAQAGYAQPGYDAGAYAAPGYPAGAGAYVADQKSKVAAGLLGIFLGGFGAHNFYLGNTGKAVAQLLITLLSLFLLSWISAIWGLIEGILILSAQPYDL